jgi:tripartite-type tricarboxylate transporter receptor subunit TctC
MNEEKKQDYNTLIAKKSEKLATALYLVTDLMSDNEPIKHGLRKNAVALLSSMNAIAQLDVKDRIIEFKMSLKAVTEIISLLHVSVTTGIVSEMNGQLLMDGFRSLQLVLEKKQPIFTKEMLSIEDENNLEKDRGFETAVSSSSYDVLTPLSLARLHDTHQDMRRAGELLKQSQILAKLEAKDGKGQNEEVVTTDKKDGKKNVSEKSVSSTHQVIMGHASKNPTTFTSSFQMRKHSRREQILALFVKGVDVSIKDIASRIRGCSEKTIQRELNALLYDNVIERIGEKRWSRYVLR